MSQEHTGLFPHYATWMCFVLQYQPLGEKRGRHSSFNKALRYRLELLTCWKSWLFWRSNLVAIKKNNNKKISCPQKFCMLAFVLIVSFVRSRRKVTGRSLWQEGWRRLGCEKVGCGRDSLRHAKPITSMSRFLSVQLNSTVINLHLLADVCIQDMLSVTADKDY